ncbi:efflux RND transporter periplasmic adaptor subunit [Geomesophilobacter sediminis]|uniref:Efflux RND transporter periplasmic adaptor subunit n=1 Tax=Geomesophilobacter sediminis TaxID=2798584 RepID=A0A8J7J066_9BACT|nr:efflux RND transporter periplasmic adaptor subunit [Geomesophilobacter sediminis]MBJ6723718.1 efflux RND transporter periplasmic adaptor subunit [Geomesophilobacter sediminis]
MIRKSVVCGGVAVLALVGAFGYRFTHLPGKGEARAERTEEPGKKEPKADGAGAREVVKTVRMEAEVQKKAGVVVARAVRNEMAGTLTATGKIAPDGERLTHVAPPLSGRIVWAGVGQGQTVGKGTVLARLESVEVAESMNRYRQSRAKLALAEKNLERVKALVEKKIAARKEIFQVENECRSASAEVAGDEQRLLLYGVGRHDLAAPPEKKILLPVRTLLGGVVTEKHATVGELADPSKSLFTVADLGTVWVLVDINEKDLARVKQGQSAVVRVGAYPDRKFRGRITQLADLVDEATRTVKARVEVPNPGRKLKPEMFATVELALPAAGPPVLAVPEEALVELEGKKVLFVSRDGTDFLPRPVMTGAVSGGYVEITAGLAEGELYAQKGGFVLKSELKKGELGEE